MIGTDREKAALSNAKILIFFEKYIYVLGTIGAARTLLGDDVQQMCNGAALDSSKVTQNPLEGHFGGVRSGPSAGAGANPEVAVVAFKEAQSNMVQACRSGLEIP